MKKDVIVKWANIRKISSQGQICIPKYMLRRLKWKNGQTIKLTMRSGKIIITPINAYMVEIKNENM